jgi:transposase
MKRLIADRGYDANRLRSTLRDQGTIPIIPGRRNRKRPIQYDERRYRDRWLVEAMFCRLKDFRRVATRHDKLARNYKSAIELAAAVALLSSLNPNGQAALQRVVQTGRSFMCCAFFAHREHSAAVLATRCFPFNLVFANVP